MEFGQTTWVCKDGDGEISISSVGYRSLICVSLVSCSLFSIMRPSVDSVCVGCSLIMVQVLVQVLVLVHPAAGYSLDQEHSLEFNGPPSSMFGYSVQLHHHGAHNWSGSIMFIWYWSVIDSLSSSSYWSAIEALLSPDLSSVNLFY